MTGPTRHLLILPGRHCLIWLGLALVFALVVALALPGLWWLGGLGVVPVLLACLYDGWRVARPPLGIVAEALPDTVLLSADGTAFDWQLSGPPGALISARLEIDGPLAIAESPSAGETDVTEQTWQGRLDAGGRAMMRFELRGRRRGRARLVRLWCRLSGPARMATQQVSFALDRPVAIAADLPRALRQAHDFQFSDQHTGAFSRRFMASGGEFDTLIEYQPGMDRRHIHWRQSARHGDLLVKGYRDERNHHIVLAFDTGFLMVEEPEHASDERGVLTRLDMAIDAGMALAASALTQGDAVGLFAFGPGVDAWMPPMTGSTAVLRTLSQVASGLPYHNEASNFTLGLGQLSMRLKRRSLILLFTEFADAIQAELLMEGLARLARTHLVLFVTLEDPTLHALLRAPPDGLRQLATSVVVADLLRDRHIVFRQLRQHGIDIVETPAGRYGGALISRYLAIKHADRL